jgi:hypothetical protein
MRLSDLPQAAQLPQDQPGLLQERLPFPGEDHRLLDAIEDEKAEVVLDLPNLLAQGRLGHMAGAGRLPEVAVLGDGGDVFELDQAGHAELL